MNVALLLWDEADLRAFTGPGQLFARAGEGGAFFVYTVAEAPRPVTCEDFLTVVPEYTIHTCPRPDVLVVPGGGAFYVAHREALLRWLRRAAAGARAVLAVGDGLRILHAAGVPGLPAPGDDAADEAGAGGDSRVVEQGNVVAARSAGAAVEGALRVIARLGGARLACDAARCCGGAA
jgi:putative intracellular protease/amidase